MAFLESIDTLYTEAKKPEKVIDGYLGDLPENLQSDVMEIHKLVIKTVNEILNTRDYSDLKNDKWAKEQLEEFCAMPADKSDIGSIRVYQRGKKYRCMIQLTGHFTNHMNDFNQELMHEFIKNVFVTVRPKIRKKYDFTITNEGDHGNPFEGFDVFPNPKLVEEIWNKLSDRKIKTVIEESSILDEVIDDDNEFTEKSHGKLKYDFRFARNADNGKMLKIVYELNKDMEVDTYRDANYSTISKLGDTDHNSKGQKVVAIIEYIDDPSAEGGRTRKLDHAKCIGPFGYNNDTVFDIKVGEIDNSYSFKSTFFPPKHELLFGHNKTYGNIKDVTIMGHESQPNQRGHYAKNKLYFNKPELMKYISMYNNINDYYKSIYDTIRNRFIADYSVKNNIDKSSKELNRVWFDHSDKLSEINELDEIKNKFDKIGANYIPPHGSSILSIIDKLASNHKSSNTSREQHNKDVERYTNELNQLLPGYIAGYKEAIKSLDSLVKKYNLDVNSNKFRKYMESVNEFTESSIQYNRVSGKLKDLPKGFQDYAIKTNEDILEAVLAEMQHHKDFDSLDDDDVKELINWMDAKNNEDGYGYFFIEKDKDDKNFAGEMRLFPKTGKEFGYISRKLEAIWNKSLKYVFDKKHSAINKKDSTKKLTLVTDENIYTLVFVFSREYAEKLYNYCINPRRFPLTESTSIEENETYNVDMTESEAKRTLGTLTASIINDINNKKPVSQYTANIYANIITKNLLPLWSKGYRKLSIKINDDNKNLSVFEFKIPSMTQDFVSRVINGRESINGLLHRTPEIKIVMSASLFNTIKDRNDAYNFFKAAVKYYDSQVEKYSMKLISEIMKLNHEMKHLIATTKLSGLVTYPMTLLFAFDNIDMSNKDCFKIDSEDLVKVTKFIKSIYTRYASPEKEKKEIINDLRVLIRTLKESLEVDENIKNLSYLPEAVDTLMNGGYHDEIEKADQIFIRENTDLSWPASSPDPQVKYLSEKFGVKKLKKIPVDLVAYIQIETESIQDSNDKMMIASYCLSKIEIVEWYIELLEVGSKKYIVPHNKQYLENVRTQLLQCYKDIMAVKITKPSDRPLIDIKYPKGYEG